MTRDLNLNVRRKPALGKIGQMLVIFALFLTVLMLFVGLGVDLGFAFITKAQLSKAVDAAALAGMSNFYLGGDTASNIAAGTFSANFAPGGAKPGYVTAMPVPQINFGTDAQGNQTLTVSATAVINTFFIRVLPQWKTLAIGDTGQATRAKVIMTLVLDRSGSMDPGCSGTDCTQGGLYLPSAVANFINVFEDNFDEAAMVSFASTAVTNVAMQTPFKDAITTAASSLSWVGGTFSHGGLTNALAINNAVAVPTNQNAIKVVVFFTDGQANMIQNSLSCSGTATWNFGGWESNDVTIGFWSPSAPNTCAGQICPTHINSGSYIGCSGATCAPSACSPALFPSIAGTNLTMNTTHIVLESEARCIQVANQMRAAGMYVYCIGLNSAGGVNVPNATFLQEVANDPASPTYDNTQPTGEALVTGNGANLTQLFQQVAGDIVLRLTY